MSRRQGCRRCTYPSALHDPRQPTDVLCARSETLQTILKLRNPSQGEIKSNRIEETWCKVLSLVRLLLKGQACSPGPTRRRHESSTSEQPECSSVTLHTQLQQRSISSDSESRAVRSSWLEWEEGKLT